MESSIWAVVGTAVCITVIENLSESKCHLGLIGICTAQTNYSSKVCRVSDNLEIVNGGFRHIANSDVLQITMKQS